MKHTKRKLTKIVDEMITYFYSMGAIKISVEMETRVDSYHICIKSDFNQSKLMQIEQLSSKLNQERDHELEEMYWNLTGLSDLEDEVELQLVSSMIDQANVEIDAEHSVCSLEMLRKRHNK